MKFRLINVLGQLQTFTQFDEKGKPSTIRLYANKPLEIEAASKDDLPHEIKLAEKARYIFIREVKEPNKVVMGVFPNTSETSNDSVEGGGK